MNNSNQDFFTTPSGHRLFWRYHPIQNARAHLFLVHGIGEHSGRYIEDIPHFHALGLNVFAYDQYGHGQSDGKRGTLDIRDRLDQDLLTMRHFYRQQHPELPLILFGHSMGGAVVANHLVNSPEGIEAAVLASPALKLHLSPISNWFADVMATTAPQFSLHHGLASKVSHLESVNSHLKNDPLCHKNISGLLGQFISQAGDNARNHASDWIVPTLLLYAGTDYLVNADGSKAFAKKAPPMVEAHCFTDYYHEIFHERDVTPVYEKLSNWLEKIL